jgi:putative ABC transport system ATP-binding protein
MTKNKCSQIVLRNVIKRYPLNDGEYYEALHGINLEIRSGELIAIVGPSGSGKSTLMHILGALDTPTSGTYELNGKDITAYSRDQLAEIRNQEIGFVFQSFNLLPRTTVFGNIEKPMIYGRIHPSERKKRVMEALRLVNLEEKAQNLSNRVSGGQIQRVAIARAIVMHPTIILADEPTGNLDTKTSKEIMDFFVQLNNEGRTIVVITHEEDIASYAKRVIRIVDGTLQSDVKK